MEKGTPKQKKTTISREFSSGGVVYQRSNKETLWLISKSSPSKDYPKPIWRLQKGWIDDRDNGKSPGKLASGKVRATEEMLREAALREVREEGGVKVEIIRKLPTERYFYNNKDGKRIMKFVTFYLMRWVADVPEGFGFETSEIRWLSYKKARKVLSHYGEKKILDVACKLLDSGVQPGLI